MSVEFHIPVNLRRVQGEPYLVPELEYLSVVAADGTLADLPNVMFDTGAGITTIPVDLAAQRNISFSQSRQLHIKGATGKGTGYLDKAIIVYPDIPEYEFEVPCVFSLTCDRVLLCLGDVIKNFNITSSPPNRKYGYGSLLLRSKTGFAGKKRAP